MKKVFLGLMAVLVSMTLFAERVSVEDAALVANNFMNVVSANTNVKKVVPAKRMVRKAMAEENMYYLYENADGEGWVIIAADDAVTPVLAYSNTGHFRTDNMPSNIRKWVGKYNNFIKKIEDDGVVASEETSAQWKKLRKGLPDDPAGTIIVGPLVTTQWDQDDPYWTLTPDGSGSVGKAYTGCVATAMAQVMKYWEWPVQGTGSHTYQPVMQIDEDNDGYVDSEITIYPGNLTANFGATTYDWDNMLDTYTSSATTAQKNAVATLMFHCGVSVEMMYGDDSYEGSGAYTGNYGDWTDPTCAQNAFPTYFGYKKDGLVSYMRDGFIYGSTKYYDSWTDAAWTAMVKAELDKKHPIMYGGAGNGGGHSFICDGYDSQDYFHFNWGWSGSNDGWYKLSNLVPGSGGAGGGSYSFSEDQDVIIGIVPDKEWPEVIVTWSVAGSTNQVTYHENDALVLPSAPTCEDGKVFVGWTKQSSVDGSKPADLFTSAAGKIVSEAVTYYAVFADKEEGSSTPSEVASVTFKTSDSDSNQEVTNISSIVSQSTGIASSECTKVYQGKEGAKLGVSKTAGSMTLTLSSTYTVSKVVVNASQFGTDTGKLTVTAGSTQLGSAQSPASNLEFAASTPVETNKITIATSSKRAYVQSISVVAVGGVSYSNYSLSCEGAHQAIENTKVEAPAAYKTLIDGRIVIVRGDAVYTLTGARVK